MTLSASYLAFLNNPARAALADDASLHYIPTLTTLHDAAAVMKHLAVQEKLLKKKSHKILDTVESRHGLSADVEVTIEFENGGGAYLPGLDDNFIADRTVTFPMIHIVRFDNAGKIVQMRQYWDQGSLLKQMDVIGARSRNWPIRDATEQARLISSSAAAVASADSPPSTRPSTRGADDASADSRSRGSTSNAMNDPHASLSLFQARKVDESSVSAAHPSVPRVASAKPPPREYGDLFVGGDDSPAPPQQKFPVKGGSSKHFKDNRLFDETEEDKAAATPTKSIKTNEKKYNHFEFGDGEDESTPRGRETSRHTKPTKSQSNWNFEDFVTPEKTASKTLPQAVRNFGWSDDEEEASPVRRPIVHKARPDADPHFEFNDEGTPAALKQKPSTKGSTSNKSQGLYKDHVTADDDNEGTATGDRRTLAERPIRSQNRSNDFGAHWEMNDNSPAMAKRNENQKPDTTENQYKINIAGNGMGGRKGTEFSLFDEVPEEPANSRKIGNHTGIQTAGDGMGGRKGADKSFWDF